MVGVDICAFLFDGNQGPREGGGEQGGLVCVNYYIFNSLLR